MTGAYLADDPAEGDAHAPNARVFSNHAGILGYAIKLCHAVGAVCSQAAAPPVVGSCIFDPGLLLGNWALHELGPFLLVGRHALAQRQLANSAIWSGYLAAIASKETLNKVSLSTGI